MNIVKCPFCQSIDTVISGRTEVSTGYQCNSCLVEFEDDRINRDVKSPIGTKTIIITELVSKAFTNAKEKGFWEDFDHIIGQADKEFSKDFQNNAIGNRLMLITGEVAEAHEALRKADMENFKEELADIVIRVADLAGGLGIDLEAEILKKMEKNKTRAYKHGKQF